MENEKNKRAGIGQKPRGRQQTRGVEALPGEKQVASNEGQEEGVKDPVSEPADRVQEGGGLLEEISTISDKTAENEKMSSVAVSESKSLEEMLAKSIHEDGHAKEENPLLTVNRETSAVRRATPEEEEAFRQQKMGNAIRDSGGFETARLMSVEEANKYLASLAPQAGTAYPQLGQQPDGSFKVAIRLAEGYIEPVRQWAEAEGITVEEWCSRQLSHYLETWGQPAKSR